VLADADDGLAARLLYIWPEPVPIVPLADRGDDDASRRREMLVLAARRLRALAMGTDANGTPTPRTLRFDSDARTLFDELRREAMTHARRASGLAAGWAGKNPGRALRLALVYEILTWAARDDAEPTHVSAEAVARAGAYLDYAANMLDRVTAGLALTAADADAAFLARYLLAMRPARLNERGIYQMSGFAWTRDRRRRAAALALLDHAGWIRRPAHVGPGRPRGDWEVSPRLGKVKP
jgi:hypothetical protein